MTESKLVVASNGNDWLVEGAEGIRISKQHKEIWGVTNICNTLIVLVLQVYTYNKILKLFTFKKAYFIIDINYIQ